MQKYSTSLTLKCTNKKMAVTAAGTVPKKVKLLPVTPVTPHKCQFEPKLLHFRPSSLLT